ncbi:MAG: hypothetical protein Q8L10_00580 [Candidatus Moranbacteria bacterium]|nr:hypothetical protein [Candidatus Moranbacteria bacterium]
MENIFLKSLERKTGNAALDRVPASEEGDHRGADIFDGRFADHKAVLAKLDAELEARIGYSKRSALAESQRDVISRVAEKIISSEAGNFVDETVLASAVELSHFIKVSLSLNEEMEHRETADLAGELESVLGNFWDSKGEGEMSDMGKEKFIDAAALLAEIESRLERSYYQKNDPAFPVSEEYSHTDVLLAQGKVALRKIVKDNQDFVPKGKSFDEFFECLRGIADLGFDGGNGPARKNKLILKKMRHNPLAFRKLVNMTSVVV